MYTNELTYQVIPTEKRAAQLLELFTDKTPHECALAFLAEVTKEIIAIRNTFTPPYDTPGYNQVCIDLTVIPELNKVVKFLNQQQKQNNHEQNFLQPNDFTIDVYADMVAGKHFYTPPPQTQAHKTQLVHQR